MANIFDGDDNPHFRGRGGCVSTGLKLALYKADFPFHAMVRRGMLHCVLQACGRPISVVVLLGVVLEFLFHLGFGTKLEGFV